MSYIYKQIYNFIFSYYELKIWDYKQFVNVIKTEIAKVNEHCSNRKLDDYICEVNTANQETTVG